MKWNRYMGRILIIPAVCAVWALPAMAQNFQPPEDAAPPAADPGAGQPSAAQPGQEPAAPPADQVVATVDGEPITKQEVQTTLEPQLQGQQVPPQQVQQLQQRVVNSLIESRLVEKYLRDHGPDVETAEVEQTIDQLGQQLEAQQASMQDFLESRGYTPDMLRKRVEGSIAWQKLQQQQAADETQLQEYFEANRDQFQSPDFEEAKGQVLNAYLGAMYQGIVEQTKENVDIQIVDPSMAPAQAAPQQAAPPAGAPVPQ